ncbi:MAG TPA: hypothetical protein VJ719_07780 [Chthoniobacterales bacterium]|nr:hypothetical protein [Chthoniobacterales bacterium]
MKTTSTYPDGFESTYALLMRSEEKQRSRFETLVYTVLIGASIFALTQFGYEAITMPAAIVRNSPPTTAIAPHRA